MKTHLLLLLSANLAAMVSADGHYEYFQLQAAYGGCLGRSDPGVGNDELLLKECDFSDDNVMWRWDDQNRFRSKAADSFCIQAAKFPEILQGVGVLDRLTPMYVKPCSTTQLRDQFQVFSEDWENAALMGDLKLEARLDLCMTHQGADPVIGEAKIVLIGCEELGGDRGMGWTAVYPEYTYFTLTSASGGCIARKEDGDSDLFLKACFSNDDNIQWRLDDMGRFRSKVNDDECIQASKYPMILAGPDFLMQGDTVFVKPCGGTELRDQFQIFNTLIPVPLEVERSFDTTPASGPLSLISRPDLCMTHFGADPVLGESRIMMFDCASLGGTRGQGWIAEDPCVHLPVCPLFCTRDVKECPDGTTVGRDPLNDCEFFPCPDPTVCPADIFTCPDGSTVGRVAPDCEFAPCPPCPDDTFLCPDGVTVSIRDPARNCDFFPCPEPPPCTGDVFECPDGTFVDRVPPECEFETCPSLTPCTLDSFECPDGTSVGRDPANNCEFFPCPDVLVCTQDVFECPDGTFVSRDPANMCEFSPCPDPVACPTDIFICPDGTNVPRLPPDCEFAPCPDPVPCTADIFICPDGTELVRLPPDCEYPPCPPCPLDIFTCPDGTDVKRVPPACEFETCPEPVVCAADIFICDDGTELTRLPPDCEFPPCPEPVVCPADVFVCPDGVGVPRVPPDCEFAPCP